MKNSILLFLFIIILNLHVKAQVFHVFAEDTMYYTTEKSPFYLSYGKDLKNQLPDGNWFLYNIPRTDSSKYCLDEVVVVEGKYMDSLRNGQFKYYSILFNKKNKKRSSILSHVLSYKNGYLDGYCYYLSSSNIKEECYYKEGRKNGFNILYYDNYKEIKFYKNDTLQDWWKFMNKVLLSKGFGEYENTQGEYIINDSIGNLFCRGFFKNGVLQKYEEYYDNSKLKIIAEGDFKNCNSTVLMKDYDGYLFQIYKYPNAFCVKEPINGYLKEFDRMGNQIRILKFKDGKIL